MLLFDALAQNVPLYQFVLHLFLFFYMGNVASTRLSYLSTSTSDKHSNIEKVSCIDFKSSENSILK